MPNQCEHLVPRYSPEEIAEMRLDAIDRAINQLVEKIDEIHKLVLKMTLTTPPITWQPRRHAKISQK